MPARAPHEMERDAEAKARRNELERSFRPQRPSGPWPVPLTDPRPWTIWGYMAAMAALIGLFIVRAGTAVLIGQLLFSALLLYFLFAGSKIAWGLALVGGITVVLASGPDLFSVPSAERSATQVAYLVLHVIGLALLVHPTTLKWFELKRSDGL